MPAPVTALPLPACGVRGAHLDGEWVFREGKAPPYNMSRSTWPEIWQRPGNTHYYGLPSRLSAVTQTLSLWTLDCDVLVLIGLVSDFVYFTPLLFIYMIHYTCSLQ